MSRDIIVSLKINDIEHYHEHIINEADPYYGAVGGKRRVVSKSPRFRFTIVSSPPPQKKKKKKNWF